MKIEVNNEVQLANDVKNLSIAVAGMALGGQDSAQ